MLSVQLEEQMKKKLDKIIMNRAPVFLWKRGASIQSIIIVIKFILSSSPTKNFQVYIDRIQWNRYIKVSFKDYSVIKRRSGKVISGNNPYVASVWFLQISLWISSVNTQIVSRYSSKELVSVTNASQRVAVLFLGLK